MTEEAFVLDLGLIVRSWQHSGAATQGHEQGKRPPEPLEAEGRAVDRHLVMGPKGCDKPLAGT